MLGEEQCFSDMGKNSGGTPEESLTWRIFPARSHPQKAAIAVLIIALFCGFVLWRFSSVVWVVFSGVVLFLSIARFFLPTTYHLTPTHVSFTFLGVTRSRAWSDFRRVEREASGVFLSPFETPGRLDNYRGLFLLCGKNLSEVLDFARRHIKEKSQVVA
jgi:hypothetical protein